MMKHINITAKIDVCDYAELSPQDKSTVDAAKEATQTAYAPYSRFQVGVAVRLVDGTIVAGNNQENAAYPSGLCAERTALFYANARYPHAAVEAIAVAAYANGDYTDKPITPCGACRQVIVEAQSRYKHPIRMILYGKKEVYLVAQITDLMPLAFAEF
ncbi:cytidine deaminase [Bacteroidia bacterium]|nr:cytidine deaminase [Bacteroidia bacterium]